MYVTIIDVIICGFVFQAISFIRVEITKLDYYYHNNCLRFKFIELKLKFYEINLNWPYFSI